MRLLATVASQCRLTTTFGIAFAETKTKKQNKHDEKLIRSILVHGDIFSLLLHLPPHIDAPTAPGTMDLMASSTCYPVYLLSGLPANGSVIPRAVPGTNSIVSLSPSRP